MGTKWINVNDELPREGENVLCWYEYFQFGGYNRMVQTYGIGYQYNGHWGGEIIQEINTKVLYWMHLPEKP